MAIALSPFEALCGFASFEEIREAVAHFPELERCIESDSLGRLKLAVLGSHKQVWNCVSHLFKKFRFLGSERSLFTADGLLRRSLLQCS